MTHSIHSLLSPGEHVLWSGQPRRGVQFRPSDLTAIPFSLLWAGFAFFWEWNAIHSKGPLLLRLWGVPFVLAGCQMLVGRFITDAWQRARTVYGLTSQRVIIATSGFRSVLGTGLPASSSVRSFDLRTLADTRLVERGDGSGTIELAAPAYRTEAPALEMIEDAASVYDRILRAQREAHARER